LGRFGEALVALEKAARLDPRPEVLLELADLSLRCERPEHARRALEDVLVTLPRTGPPEKLAEVRARLGQACEMLGDLAAAPRHCPTAGETMPSPRGWRVSTLSWAVPGSWPSCGRSGPGSSSPTDGPRPRHRSSSRVPRRSSPTDSATPPTGSSTPRWRWLRA